MFLQQLTLFTLPLLTFAQQPPATFSSIASSIHAKYSTVAAYTQVINQYAQVAPPAVIMWKDPSLKADEASSILASQQENYFATQTLWKDIPAEVTGNMKEAGRQGLQNYFIGLQLSASLEGAEGSGEATKTPEKTPVKTSDKTSDKTSEKTPEPTTSTSKEITSSVSTLESIITMSAAQVVNWVDGTSTLWAGNAAAATEPVPASTPTDAQEDADSGAGAGLGVKMGAAALGGIVAVALVL